MTGGRELGDGGAGSAAPGGSSRRAALGALAACGGSAGLVVALWPEALHACPVCFDRDDEARIAFLATTGLLTLLPLGLVAGVGAWLRKRAGRQEKRGDGDGLGDAQGAAGEPEQ